jgi:hypothetical protein
VGLTADGRQMRYHVIVATAGNLQEVEQLQQVAEAVGGQQLAMVCGVWHSLRQALALAHSQTRAKEQARTW